MNDDQAQDVLRCEGCHDVDGPFAILRRSVERVSAAPFVLPDRILCERCLGIEQRYAGPGVGMTVEAL
jgi:hypothetical protein